MSARRRFGDGSFAAYMKPQTVAVADSGLHVHGDAGDSTIAWDAVLEIVSLPNAVYVFLSSIQAIIVPRRAFADDHAQQSFVATLSLRSGRSSR